MQQTLLSEIEAYCAEHEISEYQFGEHALNDRHLVRQLREGRDIRLSTVDRIRHALGKPPSKAAA